MNLTDEKNGVGLSTISSGNMFQSTTAKTELKASKYTVSSYDNNPDDEDTDTQCGLGSWTPKWLQVAANPKLFLFFYSLAGICQGAVYTYLVGCMSTLEKRFSYDTKRSGLIMMADEIVPLTCGVLFGYFGGLANRPKVLMIGMILGSLSSFIFTIPYFIYGSVRYDPSFQIPVSRTGEANAQFCDRDFNDLNEACSNSVSIPVVLILVIGNFMKGASGEIFYIIGTTYMDDSIEKKQSSVYLGMIFASRMFGPAFGFLLSSFCLQFYEDPFYDPGYGPSDNRWVGAWWLGFVILGVLIIIFSAPIILFPKRLSKKKMPLSLQKPKKEPKKSPIEQLKGMGKALKRLGKNPILVIHCFSNILRLNGLIGYFLLLPKYMEMQFRQTASKASLYTGPVSIIGMQLGIILGGFAIRRFKPRPRVLTGSIVLIESFTVIALLACMFITCPFQEMQETSRATNPLFSPENDCNADCMCTTKSYTPVCGPDGKSTYFSPCYAGCSRYNKTEENEVFTNCKCVHNDEGEFVVGEAINSYCGFECQWMVTYVVILTVGKLISSTAHIGSTIVTLRCVDPEDKSVALGAASGLYSLLAFIPSPIFYGALTDACCLVWEKSCGTTGNCWVYDVNKFRYLLHGVSASFVFLGCVTDIIVWYLSPRLQNLYDEDEDEKTGESIAETEVTNSSEL